MSKPVAVVTADVHYNINTIALADAAMRQAVAKAEELGVPLVIAGDLHDTKAIHRGECISAMIETFKNRKVRIVVIPGNHCLINEKGRAHSLTFLEAYCDVVSYHRYDQELQSWLIPYQTSTGELQCILGTIEPGSRIICHQGIKGADMGSYIQDKTALSSEHFSGFRTLSGHYHRRQDIQCGQSDNTLVGTFSYIGNPYSLAFGEANDGPKGFQVLYSDGSLEFIPTNLRKHIVCELTVDQIRHELETGAGSLAANPGDLLWIKVKGPHDLLQKLKKTEISKALGRSDFKLDKIYTDSPVMEAKAAARTAEQTMDAVIDNGDYTDGAKAEMKALWREVVA